jgi:anti-sigma regulatory factor (Ser/Thr protein kinase)
MPVTTASRSGASQPRPAAAGPPRAFLDLGAVLTAPGCARAWTREILWEWGAAELAESAELVASELVTNSVNAGGGGIRLVLTLGRGELAVLVRDGHPGAPLAGQPGADDESGRGLLIVEALSDRCGWYTLQGPQHAKVTWAVISAPASGGEPPAGARAGGPAMAAETRAVPALPARPRRPSLAGGMRAPKLVDLEILARVKAALERL